MDKPQTIDFDSMMDLIGEPLAADQLMEYFGQSDHEKIRFFTHGTTVFCDASMVTNAERGVLYWNDDEESWTYITGT